MIVIFEYGHGSIRFTVEAESAELARNKISDYLQGRVITDCMVDCGYEFDSHHWISEGDYNRWFAGEFKSTVVDDIHISYR